MTSPRHHPRPADPQAAAGFALIESLLAILVFSLGILALVGFQAAAVRQAGDARQRADASFIANQIEGDLWGVAPGDLSSCDGTYTQASTSGCAGSWGQRLASLPGGKAVVDLNGTTATITITWKMPGDPDAHTYTHIARIERN